MPSLLKSSITIQGSSPLKPAMCPLHVSYVWAELHIWDTCVDIKWSRWSGDRSSTWNI